MNEHHKHFKLYKPFGILSQLFSNDSREQKTKRFLSELYDFPQGIMPVGRLDEKSEGLLLLTSDGVLSDHINKSGIEKEYFVQLDGVITSNALMELRRGVEIGFHGLRYLTKPCKVDILDQLPDIHPPDERLRIGRHRPTSWISITVREGKFRQVRKMTAAVGFPTQRLIRVRIGAIVLDGMTPGETVEIKNLGTNIK